MAERSKLGSDDGAIREAGYYRRNAPDVHRYILMFAEKRALLKYGVLLYWCRPWADSNEAKRGDADRTPLEQSNKGGCEK